VLTIADCSKLDTIVERIHAFLSNKDNKFLIFGDILIYPNNFCFGKSGQRKSFLASQKVLLII